MNTIEFFKEISLIPRESGNEEKISEYIVSFAKERNLEYIKDKYNNVIVKKYVNDTDPIILQAHLDMVCVKDSDIDFDFDKDSLNLVFEDGYIKASGTTLGADNGIGVAQILNVLDSNIEINIEAIFTTSEETSMLGAEKIDVSSLRGKTMINLDGFDSDTILIGSASFTDIDIKTNYSFKEKGNNLYKIKLSGLLGGHSGDDINKNRGSALLLLTELLLNMDNVLLSSFNGGVKINVIPTSAEAIIKTNSNIENIINSFLDKYKKLYSTLNIEIESIEKEMNLLTKEDTNKFLNSIIELGHGVISTNNREEVVTSKNLAVINLENDLITVGLRSSKEDERLEVIKNIKDYCSKYSYVLNIFGYQPGFYTEENSELVKNMESVYFKLNNKKPDIKTVHAGLEVGLLKEKIKDLEVVVISPNITGAHTTEEKVEISSIENCDKWLLEFLNNI